FSRVALSGPTRSARQPGISTRVGFAVPVASDARAGFAGTDGFHRARGSESGPACALCDCVRVAARARRADDGSRFEAETLATEARQLFRKGDRASLHDAVDRGQRALARWRDVGERDAELATLEVSSSTYALRTG